MQERSALCLKHLCLRCLSDLPGRPVDRGPSRRAGRPLHPLDLGREFRILGSIGGKEFRPLPPRISAARSYAGAKMLVDAVGHKKLGILGPAVTTLREPNLLISERLAVGRSSVLSIRRTVAYMTIQNDERGAVFRFAKAVEGVLDALDVVGVADAQNVPPVGEESRLNVLGKGDARFTLMVIWLLS